MCHKIFVNINSSLDDWVLIIFQNSLRLKLSVSDFLQNGQIAWICNLYGRDRLIKGGVGVKKP